MQRERIEGMGTPSKLDGVSTGHSAAFCATVHSSCVVTPPYVTALVSPLVIFAALMLSGISANAAPSKAARCQALFESSTDAVATGTELPKAESAAKAKRDSKKNSIGVTETITSIYTGSQLYTVVLGESGKRNAQGQLPGLYKRDVRDWKLLIPGEVMLDAHGAPFITQLSLGKGEKNSYVVTVIDGNVHLLTGLSDAAVAESFVQFRTLFEVGSMQRRNIPTDDRGANVSIYQDSTLSAKGSQLVLVSMKHSTPQASGEGVTFAFDVLPNQAGSSNVRLNGNPIILDYQFRDGAALEAMVATSRDKQKYVSSRILVEQFQYTELSMFGEHVQFIRDWILKMTNRMLATVAPEIQLERSSERLAYNMTEARTERDVTMTRELLGEGQFEFEQRYMINRGVSEVFIKMPRENMTIPGKIDLLAQKKSAIWLDGEHTSAILSVDGILHAVLRKRDGNYALAEIGDPAEVFAASFVNGAKIQDMSLVSYMADGTKAIEKGFVILSMKLSTGADVTGVVRFNLLLQKTLQKEDAFEILPYAPSVAELSARLRLEKQNDPLFDILTPPSESVAAYEQSYDPSRPHLNVLESSSGTGLAFKFKHPSRTVDIVDKITFAEFTETEGVENPSGLYFNKKSGDITGNESYRAVGELLARAGKTIDEAHPERQFVFAKFEDSGNFRDAVEDSGGGYSSSNGNKAFLFAVDAKRKQGREGFRFVLAVSNAKHEYVTFDLKDTARQNWVNNIASFKHAEFVRGRRNDRNSVYLIISFSNPNAVAESTHIYRIDMSKPDEAPKKAIIDGLQLTSRELQDRIGFDEDGIPSLILTPELNHDAQQFALFDLRVGSKIFPNKSFGEKKRKFKFGELKNGSSQDDGYVAHNDAWAASRADVTKKYPHLGRSNDLAQFDSFVALGRQLDAMSSNKTDPERMILIVPESLRELVWDFVLNRGFGGETNFNGNDANQWLNRFNLNNRKLHIDIIDSGRSSQEQYLANIDNWAKSRQSKPDERTFVLGRMDEILSVSNGFPDARDANSAFALNYVTAGSGTDLTNVATQTASQAPSSLYLIASEQPVQLREFRIMKPKSSASVLIVATPEEMKKFESNAAHEIENGLFEHFRRQEIRDPDQGSMAMSLADIFRNPDVKTLDFKFSAKEIKPRAQLDEIESFNVVVEYAISRFTFLLDQKKDSRFESFMRFRAAFAQAVLSDKEVRRTRLINKFFIERVLTQVFDIPMNLATLPADDPMVVLSRKDSLLLLQEAGYSGPFDLKARVRDTLLSQTRADAGKPVPSSVLLFGNTGSGKTFLFKSLVKMLKLKLYDFNRKPLENQDANAIIINVGQLKEKGGNDRENDMDVDQALAHLTSLLSMPNGHRSWILFDDVHAASDAVKGKILNWQRSIFESQDGMYSVTSEGELVGGLGSRVKRTIRRPVRNLNFFMTVNPTADQDQISRFAKDKAKPTTEEVLLATLSSGDFKIEPSFLRRWGRIINLDYMPAGAKGPELLKSISKASNSLLNTMSRIVLVDPKVVSKLVSDNEQVDARSFLAASTSALVEVASNDRSTGSLVLVVPSLSRLSPRGNPQSMEASSSERIMNWVVQNTRTLALDSSLEGNLAFIKLIADAFRTPVYESLAMALQEHPKLAGSPVEQQTMLAPMLAAISDHLSRSPYISLNDLNLNASQFAHRTPGERDLFSAALAKMTDPYAPPLYPAEFKVIDSVVSTWRDINGQSTNHDSRTRMHVISSSVRKNSDILKKRLAEVLRVRDLDQLPQPTQWLVQLSGESPANPKEIGRELTTSLWDFMTRVFDAELAENRDPNAAQLTVYSATRLYLYSIDRAMTQMDWVAPSKFLLKSLELITEDQVLSQKPGVQSFLFTDPQRLIRPSIPDFTFQIISSAHALEEVPQQTREIQRATFERDLKRLIAPNGPKVD